MNLIADAFRNGGPFMYVNLVCSVATITIIVERAIYLMSRNQVRTDAFLDQIKKFLQANNLDRAVKLCATTTAPVAQVAKAGLSKVNKGEDAVATAIEETLTDVTPELRKRIPSLWSLANIATLFGLLGTISGLIGSFKAVADAPTDQKTALLSKGIAEAMWNTAFGLAIAVTCMVAHLFLNGLAKKMAGELEGFALKLENLLSERQPSASSTEAHR